MRFHLEDHTQPVSDIDRPRVFARSLHDTRPGRRQLFQVYPRTLVGAVLGPHHREHAQFRQIGPTPKDVDDFLIFIAREVVLSDEVLGDEWHAGLYHDLAVAATKLLWDVPNTRVCMASLQALLDMTGEAHIPRLAESICVINEP